MRLHGGFFFVALVTIFGFVPVHAGPHLRPWQYVSLAKGMQLYADVDDLRPTQPSVGAQEVDEKLKQLRNLSHEARHAYLQANPVPVVVGPGGHLYLVDHHHLASAILADHHESIRITVIDNLSSLSKDDFWKEMRARHWVYLFDKNGHPLPPEDLPKHIQDLQNDSFRSLAGIVRDKGGFLKTSTAYFIEFQWAVALRQHFAKQGWETRDVWRDKDVERALEFAKKQTPGSLPGVVPMCRSIFN